MSRKAPNQARSHDVSAPARGPAVPVERAADLTGDQLTLLAEALLRQGGTLAGKVRCLFGLELTDAEAVALAAHVALLSSGPWAEFARGKAERVSVRGLTPFCGGGPSRAGGAGRGAA